MNRPQKQTLPLFIAFLNRFPLQSPFPITSHYNQLPPFPTISQFSFHSYPIPGLFSPFQNSSLFLKPFV